MCVRVCAKDLSTYSQIIHNHHILWQQCAESREKIYRIKLNENTINNTIRYCTAHIHTFN